MFNKSGDVRRWFRDDCGGGGGEKGEKVFEEGDTIRMYRYYCLLSKQVRGIYKDNIVLRD